MKVDEAPRTVRHIKVQIGCEYAEHIFERDIPISKARELAQHFLDALALEPPHDLR